MRVSFTRLITYLMVFATLVFMFWFNRRRVVLFFMIAMIMYLVSAILLFLPAFSLPEISLQMKMPTQQAGTSNEFLCCLNYRNYYPFTRIRILYGIKHKLEKDYHHIDVSYNIYHGIKEYTLDLNLKYCGIYEIRCEEIRIFDLLGLFSKKLKKLPHTNAVVLPNDIGLNFNAEKLVLDDEEDIYTDPYAGSDVSEIKELRDYREGDRLSQIHWKLSTKSEDLIVKEYAKNAGVCVVLACDGSYVNPAQLTAYYELLLAFGTNMIKSDMFFELVYYNTAEEDTVSRKIDNLYNLTLTMQEMFFSLRMVTLEELEAYYNRNGSALKLLYLTRNDIDAASFRTLLDVKNVKVIVGQ